MHKYTCIYMRVLEEVVFSTRCKYLEGVPAGKCLFIHPMEKFDSRGILGMRRPTETCLQL